MVQEQTDKNGTELEHPMDTIRRTVNEKLADLGYKYCEESVSYLLTGESVVEKNSEARLLEDVKYLLMKVRMLEDMVQELMIKTIEKDSTIQTTIDDHFLKLDELESIGVK